MSLNAGGHSAGRPKAISIVSSNLMGMEVFLLVRHASHARDQLLAIVALDVPIFIFKFHTVGRRKHHETNLDR